MDKLSELARDLLAAKKAEKEAEDWRILLEEEIAGVVASDKLEGTKTVATPGYKVSVTTKLTRLLDMEAYLCVKDRLPQGADFVELKPAVDLRALRIAEKVAPEVVAACVTTKPAKTAIKVVEV